MGGPRVVGVQEVREQKEVDGGCNESWPDNQD